MQVFFAQDRFLFGDFGTNEKLVDIIDFVQQVTHLSRNEICQRLITMFKIPRANPYYQEQVLLYNITFILYRKSSKILLLTK